MGSHQHKSKVRSKLPLGAANSVEAIVLTIFPETQDEQCPR